MRLLFVFGIFLILFISGCTEKEQKELGQEIVKQAINQTINDVNPFKGDSHGVKEQCETSFKCSWDTVVKVSCETGSKVETIVGPSYEFCDPAYYRRIICESGTLKDSGELEQNTYCLVQNTKVGRVYCRGGQIKREIMDCQEGSACILNKDGVNRCVPIPKGDSNAFVDCPLDYKGKCPSNCVEYFGRCVYPP